MITINQTVKIDCDAFKGYATIIKVGKSGTWVTVHTSNGGTMTVGVKRIVG